MLRILRNDFFGFVSNDVVQIANDPILEIDPDTGIVYYDLRPTGFAANVLFELAMKRDDLMIGLSGQTSDFSVAPKPNMRLRDMGGFTAFDDPLKPKLIEIVYDAQRCGGFGPWVDGTDAGSKIEMPSHVVLLHEMIHAQRVLHGEFSWDLAVEEQHAVDGENQFRQELFLPLRGGHGGGCRTRADADSQSRGFFGNFVAAGGSAGNGCFVATAAFGSELDPNVMFLRHFRDDVIRATRFGADWWSRYWERYRRLSPPIAALMDADPELRELVRWSLVEPIVHFLELVQSFPDASLEGVPEPWASWLAEQRATLVGWLDEVDLPTSFDGMQPDAVVAELSLLLGYVLRTPEARDEYLARLHDAGALPLVVEPEVRGALAETLAATPATADRVDAILAPIGAHPLLRAYGGTHVFAISDFGASSSPYTVTVRNATDTTFSQVVIFYQASDADGIVFLTHEEVAPTDVRVFVLGSCDEMESYVVGVFDGDDLVTQIPDTGHITATSASVLNTDDQDPCADSWVIQPW